MAVPVLILPKPYILIQPTGSSANIETVDSPLIFGNIVIINELSDFFSVNDSVIFNPNKGEILRYDGVDFYLIEEQYIYSKEVAV